jgi:hypothetical protein
LEHVSSGGIETVQLLVDKCNEAGGNRRRITKSGNVFDEKLKMARIS